MGYLEEQVEKLEKRIRKIKENPDPTKSRGTLVYYEAELEQRKAQIAGLRDGRPFAEVSGAPGIMARALGFELINASLAVERIRPEKVPHYFDQVKQLGFPDYLCDRTILCLPLQLLGSEFPHPSLVLYSMGACELHAFSLNAAAHLLNVPIFYIDVPFEDDFKPHLEYLANQVEQFIAFAEAKVPGIKYDEDRWRRAVEIEGEWYALNHQIYEFRKQVPCPQHPQDVFRLPLYPSSVPNPEKIVDYVRTVRDDLSAKVERGYSPVKEEKLRVMWTTTGPFGSKIWDLLLERGVTVPYYQVGNSANYYSDKTYPGVGNTTEYGRKLRPIEEVARMLTGNSFAGTAKRWVDQALVACRECKIDAIINFDQGGCLSSVGFSRLLKDAAQRELGIPSLSIVGRQLVRTKEEEDQMLDQVDKFLTDCIKRKGM